MREKKDSDREGGEVRSLTLGLLVVLLAFVGLYFLNLHLSESINAEIPPAAVNQDPAEVELLLDEAFWWLSQGEAETALVTLEELKEYCEMTGLEVPPEAAELYDQALEEWLLFNADAPLDDGLTDSEPAGAQNP